MKASQLDKAKFVAVFGGVFEHSPWIAEAVWDSGLAVAMDRTPLTLNRISRIHVTMWDEMMSV